jgi:anti-anti-sigma factor
VTHPARIASANVQPTGVHVAEVIPSDRRLVTGLEAGPDALATYLADDLMHVADRSEGPVVLNLDGVDWIDSGACAVLVRFWRTLRANDRTVVLCVTDPVREAFRITGLIRLVPCFGNLNEAIEAARVGPTA